MVASGPDAGKSFALDDELVHIGRSDDNHVVLRDEGLADHQASIVYRGGRYAIYAPQPGSVFVEGSEIPAEKWVWLPETASIRLGEATLMRMEGNGNGAAPADAAESTPAVATPLPVRAKRATSGLRRPNRKGSTRPGERRKQVAKFINDRGGAPLVRLGEDGQLPALELAELAQEERRESQTRSSSNPVLLYVALGASFVMSIGMLLIDTGGDSKRSASETAEARGELRAYFGDDATNQQPYQALLRQALVDHSQGDEFSERRAYRLVLQMLNAADIRDPQNLNGLTGKDTGRGRASDDDLRELLETLLAE